MLRGDGVEIPMKRNQSEVGGYSTVGCKQFAPMFLKLILSGYLIKLEVAHL
jgi:hypothetical protein